MEATLALGFCYFHGEGVVADKARAMKFFQSASDKVGARVG